MADDFPINWLLPGRLGGCARPDSRAALRSLAAARCRLLISLTAEWTPDVLALKARGIASLRVPIIDFTPPTNAEAETVIRAIRATPGAVILHCAGGKGRTGTLLTAYLVSTGLPAEAAIKQARSRYPHWIETAGQIAFLKQFSWPP